MRLVTTRQLLVCLALSGGFGSASATEFRQLAPEPMTHPADASPAQSDCTSDLDTTGAVDATPAPRASKPARSRSPAPAHAASDNRAMPSRFHSFLPGMFR